MEARVEQTTQEEFEIISKQFQFQYRKKIIKKEIWIERGKNNKMNQL